MQNFIPPRRRRDQIRWSREKVPTSLQSGQSLSGWMPLKMEILPQKPNVKPSQRTCINPGLPISSNGQTQGGVPVSRLQLPPNAIGPEAIAFNQADRGPFTGISDGRILEYVDSSVGFREFAVTSSTRPRIICDGSENSLLEPVCGRPLGMAFNLRTRELFIADSALGLIVVGPDGRNPTRLASSAEGVRFQFLNGLDIDQNSETVFFTDTSSIFPRSQFNAIVLSRDRTGRLLSYNPRTKELRVLLRGLAGPNGVAVSRDGSFLFFIESVTNTIRRFWLKGPKANTAEFVAQVKGQLDNIKRNERGEFWVATNVNAAAPTRVPVGLRLSEEGMLLQNVTFDTGVPGSMLSEVNEFLGKLYLGLLNQRFIGTVNL